jgi:predicted dehydrogenase
MVGFRGLDPPSTPERVLMTKLRVGIIGLGEVAQVIHLPVLQSLPDRYEIHAVCDISESLLALVGDQYCVANRYLSAADMIEAGGLDAVLVLNSDEYHAEAVVAALGHGIDVLVEKPMCLNLREAQEIIEARDRSGRTVMVGYMRRFAPAFLEAKEQLADLGAVNYARVRDIIGRNQLIVDQTSLVHRPTDIPEPLVKDRQERASRLVREAIGETPADVAGAYRLLCGLGSHDLSALRELLGRPTGVAAARMWRGGGFITALLDYDGFVVTYETGVDQQLRFDAHIEVYSDTAALRIQYDTPYIRHFPTVVVREETKGKSFSRTETRPELTDPYTHELLYFHQVVTERLTPKTSPEDFVEDLELFGEIVRVLGKDGS